MRPRPGPMVDPGILRGPAGTDPPPGSSAGTYIAGHSRTLKLASPVDGVDVSRVPPPRVLHAVEQASSVE
jgi:hypothetical protein